MNAEAAKRFASAKRVAALQPNRKNCRSPAPADTPPKPDCALAERALEAIAKASRRDEAAAEAAALAARGAAQRLAANLAQLKEDGRAANVFAALAKDFDLALSYS
ncbi:MAG: hypothetical protein AAGI15_05980, partial [Pseudomonadota bacterium]